MFKRIYMICVMTFSLLLLIPPSFASGQKQINLFRSKANAFSIVFPDGWSQRDGQTPRTVVVSENTEGASIIIQVFQAPAPVDLDNKSDAVLRGFINDSFAELKTGRYPDASLLKSGTTYISNKKATWMIFTYTIKTAFVSDKIKTVLYTVCNGNKMYQILCSSSAKRYDSFDKIFLNAVRSFIFEDGSWYK